MSQKILINSNDALIDKVILYNFTVEDVYDLTELELQGLASVEKQSNLYAETNTGKKYNHIHIPKCGLFDDFFYGRSPLTTEFFGKLEISVNRDQYHNLNCLSVNELMTRVNDIERYLADELGILVNFDNIKMKKMELNKTSELDENYNEYGRILNTIISLLPRRLSKKRAYFEDNITNTLYSGNSSEVLKIYNKTAQLNKEYNTNLKKNYIRFEVTLNNESGKIKKVFGSDILWNLTDEKINKYFDKFVEDNIITPYRKHQKFISKTVSKLLSNEYQKSNHKWVENVLLYISNFEIENKLPLLFDIEDIKPLLANLHLKNRSTKHYIYKRFEKKAQEYSHFLSNNNKEKYEEIIKKLSKKN